MAMTSTRQVVGKGCIGEDTIVTTNLEALKEIVRRIACADLGEYIVVDS